jgi:two-component system response regulator YesN
MTAVYLLRRKKLSADQQAEGPMPSESFVDRGIRYIEEYFSDPELDMEKIARALNISKSSLSHQFKKQTGKSLPNYLNEIRLNRAKELLKTTDKRISEIAFEVGYNSIEHFNASFKKAEKVSPTQFREG